MVRYTNRTFPAKTSIGLKRTTPATFHLLQLAIPMQAFRRILFISSCGILCSISAFAQSTYTPPAGWQAESQGETVRLTPGDLKTGETYELIVKPPQAIEVSAVKSWFGQQIDEEAKNLGKLTMVDKGQVIALLGVQTLIRQVADASGQPQTWEYVAFQRKDGLTQLIKTAYNDKTVKRRYKQATNRFVQEQLMNGKTPPATTTDASPTVEQPASPDERDSSDQSTAARSTERRTEKSAPRKKAKEPPVTAPGKGIATNQIDGMYLHQSYGTGYGGMVIITFDPHLLLKDGSIYKNVDVSPADLDVARSKREEPDEWGTWKRTGNTFSIHWNDGESETWEDDDWFPTVPATKGDRLKGEYSSIGGGGNTALGGTFAVAVIDDIVFTSDGKFSQEKTVGGGDASVYAYSNKATSGTYSLEGYTLELRYGNGQVIRQAFYYYPDKRAENPVKTTGTIGIGSSYFNLDD